MEKYKTGTGQILQVHEETFSCKNHNCAIHNPSNSSMVEFPTNWREDKGLMERICPHGVGHPDPDDLSFKKRIYGELFAKYASIHGCDGCCSKLRSSSDGSKSLKP